MASTKTISAASDATLSRNEPIQWGPLVFGVGVGLPYLGNSFSLLGVDPRLLGLATCVIAIGIGVVGRGGRVRLTLGQIAVLVVLAGVVLAASPEQVAELFSERRSLAEGYSEPFRLLLAGPVFYCLAAVVLSPYFRSEAGHRSFHVGLLVVAACGVIVVLSDIAYFTRGYEVWRQFFLNDAPYSTIHLSTLALLAYVQSWLRRIEGQKGIVRMAVFGGMVLLLIQRTHAVLLILPLLAGPLLSSGRRAGRALVWGLAIAALAVGAAISLPAFENLRTYSLDISTGMAIRVDQYQTAWEGIRENPFGSGLASFGERHYFPYPHNIWIEAFYEEGLVIGMLFFGVTVAGLFRVVSRVRYSGLGWRCTAFSLLILTVHGAKSGSIPLSDLFFLMLFLQLGDTEGVEKPVVSRVEGARSES